MPMLAGEGRPQPLVTASGGTTGTVMLLRAFVAAGTGSSSAGRIARSPDGATHLSSASSACVPVC